MAVAVGCKDVCALWCRSWDHDGARGVCVCVSARPVALEARVSVPPLFATFGGSGVVDVCASCD